MDKLSQEVGLIVVVSFFLLLVAVGIIALVMVYRRKQTEYIHEQNRLKAAFEKEILEAQLQMQEQTMRHISQEIHDNIGGTLSLAKLNLNTIPPQLTDATEKINNSKELVTKAISDLRTLSKTLHSEAILSMGLIKSIETELKLVDKTAAFETRLTVHGTPVEIDHQKELILFRTIQESINNAIKHSGATIIEVMLHYTAQKLQITVADNGQGFNKEAVESHPDKGSGLRNMQNRARMIGADVYIDGSSGTKIQLSLPIIAA